MKIIVFVISIFFSASAYAENLIGKVVPPYPDGLKSRQGACISVELGDNKFCDYAVEELQEIGKKPHTIVIKKQIGRKGKKAIWKITDQIDYPEIRKGEYLTFAGCKVNNVFDQTVMAVVSFTESQFHKATSWAAIVNLKSGLVTKIQPNGIECDNAGWGV
ncbi:MAG: hypothetical protein OEY52_10315 [Gammaproteobacteria bacterium]|nr:hypothetical protein [Gammaproteobacteria bacterium]